MKCKSCKREIPDNSLFCNWCGSRQIKEKAISVPKPIRFADGQYGAQVMVKGHREWVKAPTEKQYIAKAQALKAELIEAAAHPAAPALGDLIDSYIAANTHTLSSSTLLGYTKMRAVRFKKYMPMSADKIPWQQAVNEEAALVSPKTVKNAWALVRSSLAAAGLPVPSVNLPGVPKHDMPWLQPDQVGAFLEKLKGKGVEFAALCALHGLRASEISALKPENITSDKILVRGASVIGLNNELVYQELNKTDLSRRDVPIMIPRLLEVVPPADAWHIPAPQDIRRQINTVCRQAGLPEIGAHGCRRTFASLAYYLGWSERSLMAVGGWSNIATVHKYYVYLSDAAAEQDVTAMKGEFQKFYTGASSDKASEQTEPLK